MASQFQTRGPGQDYQRETSSGYRLSHPQEGEEICISGVAGFFPNTANVTELKDNLFGKVDMISDDDRRFKCIHLDMPSRCGNLLEINRFDAEFFGVSPRLANALDPMARTLLEKAYEVLIDAGVNPCELKNTNTGVFVGATYSETEVKLIYDRLDPNGYGVLGTCRALLANRISNWLGITGPSYTMDTACSSSLYALDHAYRAMRDGHCDAAIVAGANLCLNPRVTLQFTRLGVLSPEGKCRSFDNDANGYVRAETSAVIFLQKAKNARRVYAQVVHCKTNADGHKEQGLTYPGKKGQRMLLTEFYQECGINPTEIDFMEAHGTGTKVGDPEELSTLDEIFCTNRVGPLKIGSVKSNLGHSEAATGLCSLAKMCIAYGTGYIPPNLHYKTPLEGVSALAEGRMSVVTEKTFWNRGLAGINSFGIGGSNAHTVLKGFQNLTSNKKPGIDDSLPRLVCVSGRTLTAVDSFLNDVESKGADVEQIRLLHAIYDYPIPLHDFRGYTLLRPHAPIMKVSRETKHNPQEEKRPIWFVFNGMGSQWAGMGTHLMTLPIFAAAIERCHRVLKPKGLDITKIITDRSPKVFDNILHSMVGVAAMQIGLCDVLKAIGIKPDFMIGHGVGELGCAYVDGCLTLEQVILTAYTRGTVSVKKSPIKGAMVDVSLGYQQIKPFCPADIEVTFHNSSESCTISGPEESMKIFLPHLEISEVSTKVVSCSNIAYHPRYKSEAGENLLKFLQQVIPEPKLRSNRWVSSSVPQNLWEGEQAKFSSAEYYTNNALNPVLFEETSRLIHSNAITIEIGPDGFLQAILKKSLNEDCSRIALIQKRTNTIEVLLTAIGRLYLLGLHPKLASLYPKMEFPVSVGTPMLSHLVKWDHRVDWFVSSFHSERVLSKGERLVEKDLSEDDTEFLSGHVVDGRNLFPATGYLEMVWETLALMKGKDYQEVAVVFENVRFQRATNIPKEGTLEFTIMIQRVSGNFEIIEGGTAIVTGRIYQKNGVYRDFSQIQAPTERSGDSVNNLTKREIYKELRLRGYNYSGLFRGLESCSIDGCNGVVAWTNNWVTFLDNLMQMNILALDSRGLYVPTRIEKISIDPVEHHAIMKAVTDVGIKTVPVTINEKIKTLRSGGVEIKGLEAAHITRRNPPEVPVVEKHTFVPLFPKYEIKTDEAIRICTQLVLENAPSIKVKVLELLDDGTIVERTPLAASIRASLEDTPLIQAEMLVLAKDKDLDLGPGITVGSTKVSGESNVAIFVGTSLLEREDVLQQALGTLKENGFLISREDLKFNPDSIPNNLDIISSINVGQERLVLFKRKSRAKHSIFVDIKGDDEKFTWLDKVKSSLRKTDNLVLVAQKEPLNGILGLVNCLRREPDGEKVICINVMDSNAPDFNPDLELYKTQLQKYLGVNVFKNGEWGTYRHLLIEDIGTVLTDHAFVHVTSRGDLSSLRWIQGNLNPRKDKQIVHVYYAPLNFRDVMTATGRIPPTVKGRLAQEFVLGFEFSGRTESGSRLMGIVSNSAIANLITVDKNLIWPIPEKWSMEEGATIPVAYGTVYYALMVKGKMQPGSTVLIHAGSGGVGQAAIHVCLFYGCTIYTTVGTAEKRAFIKKIFPTLTDEHIGNSRDTSFEELVMRQTKGKGVDIVLNSLADDKLQASVRCLGYRGRFLEIGKFDLINNSSLGMHFFSRGCSFHGVMLDTLMNGDINDKQELQKILDDGINNGCIKPLCRVVFGTEEVEKAFRFMAAGKHIGKVLIKIREEETERSLKPKHHQVQVIPRYICTSEYSYVIAGGLGGFGLELVDWLVLQGATKLVLNSRKGISTGYQSSRIRVWESYGVETIISKDDITTQAGCISLLKTANTLAPVRAIFNLAVILKDALMQNQTAETFTTSLGPKARATKFLDIESRKMCPELKQFVVFSSVSCGRGNAGQTNYGMANSVMERICEERHKAGLPALAVQWGVVGDVGLVAEMQEEHYEMEIGGTLQQRISCCLKTLNQLLGQSSPVVSSMVVAEKRFGGSGELNILDTVAAIMGLKDLKTVSHQATLVDLGMDSMMAVEIKQCLERDFEIFLTAEAIRTLSFAKLTEYMVQQDDPMVSANRRAPNNAAAFDILVRNIGDEETAKKPFINMVTLTSDGKEEKLDSNEQRIFMLPGIEGISSILTTLCARIQCKVTMLQLSVYNEDQSIEGIAQRLLETVRSCLAPKAPFVIVGYSFGGCVALEMVRILEDEGHLGIFVCIDSSPQWLKDATKLVIADDEFLQNEFLFHISHILNISDQMAIAAELATCTTWENKMEVFEKNVPNHVVHSKSYLRTLTNSVYYRLKAINNYETSWSRKLRSDVILIRTKQTIPGLEIEEHYGLQQLLELPLEIHYIEAEHANIVDHENCARIINKIIKSAPNARTDI